MDCGVFGVLVLALGVCLALVVGMLALVGWVAFWYRVSDGADWGLVVLLAPVFIGFSLFVALDVCGVI